MRNILFVSLCICLTTFGSAFADCPSADITGDCTVDINDLSLLCSWWLSVDPAIPDGDFEMGSHFENYSNEKPVHSVSVDSFSMGEKEIETRYYNFFLNQEYDAGNIKVENGVV